MRATRRDVAALKKKDVQGLVYELQVHQLELEMQNESLRCTERELHESQTQYQVLFDQAPVGYVTLDGRGAMIRANSAAARLLGLPQNELVGRRLTAFLSPEDSALLQQHIITARTGRAASCEICLRTPGRGDCETHVDISLDSEDDSICLAVLTDISERVRHLNALEALNRQLASHTGELETRNRQLEAEVERRKASEEKRRELQHRLHASERFESLGLLAAGVAHDFNNLLVSVLGNAELLLLTPGLTDDCRTSLSMIKLAGTHASGLTHRLLEFAGRGQLSMSEVDFPTLVAENVELLQTRLPHGTQLRLGPLPELPPIAADRCQLNQVVMNLVRNAIEAVEGKGVVEVQTCAASLDHETLDEFQHHEDVHPGAFAILRVQDNGPGIDATTLSRIFDPFFTTKSSGHGLGLASVLGIVHSHGGALRVHSTPGRGTRFDIALPLLQSVRAQQHVHPRSAKDWTGGGPALIIENDDHVREVLDRLLTHLGFDVTAASSGEEGLELFRLATSRFRFAVLDWGMGCAGERVLESLRGVDPSLPVILLSGSHSEMLSRHEPGVVRAHKPLTLTQLQEALQSALGDAEMTTH